MPAQLIPLWGRTPRTRDWSAQEIAQFYRVEAALVQAGIRVETDRGISDEDDPWFVFCRADDGEVIVHFARTSAGYVIAAAVYDQVVTGSHFGRLVEELVERFPVSVPRASGPRSNVVLHPSAMLIALIATAVFKMGDARAATREGVDEVKDKGPANTLTGALPSGSGGGYQTVLLESAQAAALMSAVIYAMTTEASHVSEDQQASTFMADHSAGASGSFVPVASADGPAGPSTVTDIHLSSASVVAEAAKVVALVDIMLSHPLVVDSAPVAPRMDGDKIIVAGSFDVPSLAQLPPNGPRAPDKAPDVAATAQHSDAQTSASTDHSIKTTTASDLVHQDLGKLAVNSDAHTISSSASLPSDIAALLARNGDTFADLTIPVSADQTSVQLKTGTPPSSDKTAVAVGNSSDATTKDAAATNAPVIADPAQAEQVVLQFMTHTQHIGYVTNGTMVVLYDQDDVLQHSADISSLSFHFADGSTISLVGLHLNDYSWI